MCIILPGTEQCECSVQSGFVTKCPGLKQGELQCVSTHKRADQKFKEKTRRIIMTTKISNQIVPIQIEQVPAKQHTPYFVENCGIGFPLPTTT